jgi:dTMP kinase
LRERFRAIAAAEPGRCVLIDAAAAPDAVAETVWAAVTERLK